MVTITIIKTLMLLYDNGCVWCDIDDIISFFLFILIAMICLPIALLGDIFLLPIGILIYIIRKHNYENLRKRKYTIKEFINEI